MNVKSKKNVIALALLGLTSTTAQSALHDRGNGLIYDDVLDVTWLQDARKPYTSGYLRDWSGVMRWQPAIDYAESFEYAGFDDWRLPRYNFTDNNNDTYPDCTQNPNLDCTFENRHSEIEYMFEVNLGNPSNGAQFANLNATFIDGTTGELKTILNLNNPNIPTGSGYWHETQNIYPGNEDRAWAYNHQNGQVGNTSLANVNHAWLVRDGDVLGTQEFNKRIEGGVNHTLVLKSNGELWGWGANYRRQLGTENLLTTVNTPTLLDDTNNYIAISAGHDHSLALTEDGTVLGWGSTQDGRIGNYSSYYVATPSEVGINNVQQIEAGFYHSMALKQDGTVWLWGKNDKGQLGHRQSSISKIPSQVAGLTDIKFVDSGLQSSFALTNEGQIWSWGHNSYGQLGRVTQNNEHIPALIDGLDNIKTLAAGYLHTLALDADGSVWSFGLNTSYQTGYPQRLYIQREPYKIPSLNGIVSIAAGQNYSLALKSDGTVWAWGGNSNGQLGLGYESLNETAPVQVPNINNAVAIEAHHTTTFILLKTGELLAFGRNSSSSIGNGTNQDVATPTVVLSDIL